MLHEDNLILLNGYLINGVLLYLLYRKRKSALWGQLIAMLVYTAVMLSGLMYQSEGGTAIVWWFYWLICLITHLIVLIIQLIKIYHIKS